MTANQRAPTSMPRSAPPLKSQISCPTPSPQHSLVSTLSDLNLVFLRSVSPFSDGLSLSLSSMEDE